MTGVAWWREDGGTIVTDLVKDQLLHLSLFLTGQYFYLDQAKKGTVLRKKPIPNMEPKKVESAVLDMRLDNFF